ncbi:MAG: peptide chain release factor N(5)-glutamine methyltransferase [Actinomycetota bacterium]|nr:peptide chain release factor N(5)-glutamine methyltransferase [Actinomycetota bacterium]
MSAARDALSAATDALRAAGIDSPRLDAEVLLAEATGATRAMILASPETPLTPVATRAYAEFVRRRLRREPVAYITGRKGFRRIELRVDRRVLIPRPETELLVELAVELQPHSVLDVGTGSGAIALAVADEVPDASVVATDIYPDVLEVARANAGLHGTGDRVRFAAGSLAPGSFDLLLANLPYVTEREWQGLAPELRDWEPRGALTPGPTGLEAIDSLLGELSITPSTSAGAIGLEVGEGQARVVVDLVRRAGFERVEVRPDFAGIDRVVVGCTGDPE